MRGRGDGTGGGIMSPEAAQADALDLARLDRDLRELSIEERCSFGPELRAELATEYARMQSAGVSRSVATRRSILAAAVLVLLLIGAWLVPPARAALTRLLLSSPEVGPAAVDLPLEVPAPVSAVIVELEELAVPEEPRPEPELEPPPRPTPGEGLEGPVPLLPPTLPSLLDRDRARRIVTDEYPVAMQAGGIGGVVRVLLWVRPDGAPETPTVRTSSGRRELDEAALRATRSFRFLPATRAGQKVGTWVEFSIRFEPTMKGSQPEPEYQAVEIPFGTDGPR